MKDKLYVQSNDVIDNIAIQINGLTDVTVKEAKEYIKLIKERSAANLKDTAALPKITHLTISCESDGNVALDYRVEPPKFERIRRITGYLVGTTDRWNNAKRQEEKDRVKHMG